MPQAFKCPSCGAPLEYRGGDFQKCDYCESNILVPKNELESGPDIGFDSMIGRAHGLKEIVTLARAGKKIEAIKVYRELFGVDLATAKDAVERLERGESVSFRNVSFVQAKQLSPEATKTVMKAVGIFSGSMLAIAIIPVVLIVVIVGFVLWQVKGALDRAVPPIRTTPSSSSTKPSPGQKLMQFGSDGIGAGQFKDNRTVTVGQDGKIYVGEFSGGKVQVFDSEGKFLTQWLTEGKLVISELAADRSGNIWILSASNIESYRADTGQLVGKKMVPFLQDIAVGSDGKIYVTPTNNGSIVVYDGSFKIVSEYKDAAQKANAATNFSQIAVDGNLNIYVADRKNGDICKFSPAGEFQNRFITGIRNPEDIKIDNNGRIFISDTGTITVLNSDGQKIDSFEAKQSFGIALNDAGELFVTQRPIVVKYKIGN